jgi:hypothetical protein
MKKDFLDAGMRFVGSALQLIAFPGLIEVIGESSFL